MTETHGAVIRLSENSIAFIDGIPDTCEHEYVDEVFISASGKVIHWHTYRKWASYTAQMRNKLIYQHHNQIDDPIVEGTAECRKCKKIYQPPIFDF